MIEFARREFLYGAGALGAGLAVGSYAVAQTGRAGAPYVFFAPEEASFVEVAVDRLIPPDPEWPGARSSGVPNYIDLQLAGPYGQGDRLYLKGPFKPGFPGQGYQLQLTPAQLYRTALGAIGAELKRTGMSFAAAPDDEKDKFLAVVERGELNIDGFSSAIFFETLLANTIEGFFSDPAYGGNRNMMSWRMIGFPGAYAAYAEIYTQHGIRFDREPLPMAQAGHGHHGEHSTKKERTGFGRPAGQPAR